MPSTTYNPVAMSRRERISATIHGQETDRTPISLWRHFPGGDTTPELLARSTVEYQQLVDVDLIKLMPTGMYSVMDYGVSVKPAPVSSGTTEFESGPISEPADWTRLPDVSPRRGVLRHQVEAVRLVRAQLGPDTPVLQTVFSPLTMAAKMVGGDLSSALQHEAELRQALARMAQDVIAFGEACLEAGADGFFFATQQAARGVLPDGMYERLGVPYDLQILERLRPRSWCLMLHLHGMLPFFDLANRYPVDCVNWHDRDTSPSIAEALSLTNRALVGGISRGGAVARGTPEQAEAEVRDSIRQSGGRRLIIAPGCVIPTNAPVENLRAARRAVEMS